MTSQIKNLIKSEFKKNNAKSFLFFLIFSSIIWLIVQFSQQYTQILEIPVEYENFPQDKLIETKGDQLEIRVQQTGFQLAWLRLFKPTVKIDLSKLPADSSYLKYNLLENYYDLSKSIPIDMNKAEFLEKDILIPFHKKNTKKVPVIAQKDITYAPGYSSEEHLVLLTDSIYISGTGSDLDSISQVYTKPIKLRDVNTDILEKIQLERPDEINLYQDEIYYRLEVEKFTERQMEVPVEVINAPPGTEINLYPSSVEITFKISLARYHQIDAMDFKVVCDFKELREDQKFFIPQIIEKPESVQAVFMSPRTIDYIIKK